MRVFEGLKFKRGTSFIHRLDPRVKFLISSIVFILALLFNELVILIVLLLAQLPIIISAKIHREWYHSFKGSVFLTSLIFLTNLVVGYISNNFQLTGELLVYSISMAFRFVTLMSSFSLFFLTTSPDDLSLALEQSHIPYEFCFAFTTAIRFVPVLANEAQIIVDAQKSRGLELEKGNLLKRIRNYVPILIPLIVGAIRRSLELAEAMESRGFGVKKKRTSLYSLNFKTHDYAILILSLAILAISIYIRYKISMLDIIIQLS